MSNKIILTDCDGVLLNWVSSFENWMEHKGFHTTSNESYEIHERYKNLTKEDAKDLVVEFCNSTAMCSLPPLRQADYWVKKISELGYDFMVLTSLSDDPFTQQARIMNLEYVFGDAIKSVRFLEQGAPKEDALLEINSNIPVAAWVEDHVHNALAGARHGIRSFILDHPYNQDVPSPAPPLKRVNSWAEIYNTCYYQQ